LAGQNFQNDRGTITLEEVVKLTKAGVSEEIIVARVKKAGKAFDLTFEEILELKGAGVSDAVVKILIDPGQPYSPPEKPAPAPVQMPPAGTPTPAAIRPPVNPISERVPPEPGVYYSADPARGNFAALELKPLTAVKSGGKMFKILTAGIKKPTVTGFVIGAAAKTQISVPSPGFFVRLPEKAGPEDIILLTLAVKKDRREIGLGPDAAKPIFPPETVNQYESKKLAETVFSLHAYRLKPGEYLFFLLGSSDEKKGIVGKGYEFGLAAERNPD
jgi:hypothetical protein